MSLKEYIIDLVKFKKCTLPGLNNDPQPIMQTYSIFDKYCIHLLYTEVPYFHNHSCDYFTIILWGSYEEVYKSTPLAEESEPILRSLFWNTHRFGKIFHRVKAIKSPCITFFVRRNYAENNMIGIADKPRANTAYFKACGYTRKQIVDITRNFK